MLAAGIAYVGYGAAQEIVLWRFFGDNCAWYWKVAGVVLWPAELACRIYDWRFPTKSL